MDWGRKWLVDFNAGKTQLVSFDLSNNTGAIDMKMDGSVLAKKSKKALIRSMNFQSTTHLYMGYCCHVRASAPSCYLKLLDKLQKRAVGSSLATSLEPLAHCQNVTGLSLFYRCYFGRCSSELAQLVPLPFS